MSEKDVPGDVGKSGKRNIVLCLSLALLLVGAFVAYEEIDNGGFISSTSSVQHTGNESFCGETTQAAEFNVTPNALQEFSDGLAINLTLQSDAVGCGDTVFANASLVNMLDQNVTLPESASNYFSLDDWGSHTAYPCYNSLLLQFAVFEGYYTASNISQAGEPLQLGYPFSATCPTVDFIPGQYVFMPQSGTAFLQYEGSTSPSEYASTTNFSLQHLFCSSGGPKSGCVPDTGADGYYLGAVFHNFQFGVYTIGAMDIWGDVAVAHFVVQ